MAIEKATVRRDSTRYSPTSNTEINFERLPVARSVAEMEIRYRHELTTLSGVARHPLLSLTVVCVVGVFYTIGVFALPSAVQWAWEQANEMEGLPVVAAMLASMVALTAGFSLAFLPKDLRWGLMSATAGVVIAANFLWSGLRMQAAIVVASLVVLSAFSLRRFLIAFYRSWLSADPRFDSEQTREWDKSLTLGCSSRLQSRKKLKCSKSSLARNSKLTGSMRSKNYVRA